MTQFSQPKSLYLLSSIELWERFGFYTVQTIIVLYMSKGLGMPDGQAYLLYGAFSGLLYLTPVAGGWLADRYLGFSRSIFWGGLILIAGYSLLALHHKEVFIVGMSLVILGNGLFKPNISSIVGTLYEKGDPRREGGFTLFYMGINIGALIPPLIAGKVVDLYGWHMGFIFAALGMLLSMLIFYFGKKWLAQYVRVLALSFKHRIMILLGLVLSGFILYGLLQVFSSTNWIIIIFSLAVVVYIFRIAVKEPLTERNNMLAALILTVISIGFWAIYNQTFSSLMLFAERNMNTHWLGFTIDAEFTQFYNPFFIILFSPLMGYLWSFLQKYRLNPDIPGKFAIAVAMLTLGFFVLSLGCYYFGNQGLLSAWWLVANYGIQTIGELMLSPIGLAMMTVLAPKEHQGLMMGVWFLAQASSFSASGLLANLANVPSGVPANQSLMIYGKAFLHFGEIALVLTVMSLLLVPVLRRMIRI